MRKSITVGLTLCAAVAFAGQGLANDKGSTAHNRSAHRHHPSRVAETQPRAEMQPPTYFRIPANPVIRDCVHVQFPQCSSRGGFNDGTFGLPY